MSKNIKDWAINLLCSIASIFVGWWIAEQIKPSRPPSFYVLVVDGGRPPALYLCEYGVFRVHPPGAFFGKDWQCRPTEIGGTKR